MARHAPKVIADRLASLRRAFKKRGVQAALVTDAIGVGYLTGFTGEDSWLLVTTGSAVLLTDFRYAEQAQQECPGCTVHVREGTMTAALAAECRKRRTRRLGFDPETVTVALRTRIARALEGVDVVATDGTVRKLRSHKRPAEVKAIREAVRVAEAAWAAWRERIEIGMTERRLAAELDAALRLAGADAPAFPTITAVDASAAMPHARPGKRRLKTDSVLLADFGARVGGYVCDLTRVLVAGRIPPQVRDVYRIVAEAQARAIDTVAPGAAMVDVDAAARDVIEEAGYGDAFRHGTGHGIGREIHETPAVGPKTDPKAVLEPGMVVTVEPGIYLRGRFGVRIEDDVLVTERGRRVLTTLEKDLEAMTL